MSSLTNNKPALFSAGSKIEIKLNNISKKFPGVQALDDVDFFLKSNQVHALVGENGPELVTLPKGARVHNNAHSNTMNMGASNIHVHINGRVGASDAEIKDIANKVAREINLKMNRTATNSRVM